MGAKSRETRPRVSHGTGSSRQSPRLDLIVGVFVFVIALGLAGHFSAAAPSAGNAFVSPSLTSETASGNPATEIESAGSLSVVVTAPITDRPGVPPDLHDKYWYTIGYDPPQAGQFGTTARIVLPGDEDALAAEGGLVASVRNGEFFSQKRSSTLMVREISSGDIILKVSTDLFVDRAEFADGYLFWTGWDIDRAPAGESPLYPGGGLWALAVGRDSAPILVVAPEPLGRTAAAPYGTGGRGPFKLSSSGRTLASPVYLQDGTTGRVDIVNVDALTVRTTVSDYVISLNDTVALVSPMVDAERQLIALDIDSGAVLWRVSIARPNGDPTKAPASVQVLAALIDGETGYVQIYRGTNLVLLSVDPATGAMRDLLVQDGTDSKLVPSYFAATLSSELNLVLIPATDVGSALGEGGGRTLARIFSPASVAFAAQEIELGAP